MALRNRRQGGEIRGGLTAAPRRGREARLLDGIGLWLEARAAPSKGPPRPALFLDRDGVVVVETGYLHKARDMKLAPGAAALIAACNRRGAPVVIVTNQGGVGRGYYDWRDFAAVQEAIAGALLAAAGAAWDMALACGYHPEGRGSFRRAAHPWRKPAPGMLLAAARRLPIDMARSWIVGDRATDIEAGRAAGLAGGVHVAGTEDGKAAEALRRPGYAVRRAPDLTAIRSFDELSG